MIHNIEVESGKSVKLSTAGKYCDRDIVVAGKGPTEADLQTKYDEGARSTIEKMTSINYLFSGTASTGYNQDLFDILMSADLSNVNRAQYVFHTNSWLTEFIVPDTLRPKTVHGFFQLCTTVKRVSGFDQIPHGQVLTDVFNGCTSLEDAGTINFTGVNYASKTFQNCTALKHIVAAGTIAVSLDIHWSTELTKASIESIMAALSTTTSGLSVTFSATAVSNAFTDTEWATLANTRSNWTINLV
ncbi:MAG: hypothetical protein IJA11_08740 [Oscillospiraceae bacterium]|nr:hypothetical protein [Oscillospiraceae bacterium]